MGHTFFRGALALALVLIAGCDSNSVSGTAMVDMGGAGGAGGAGGSGALEDAGGVGQGGMPIGRGGDVGAPSLPPASVAGRVVNEEGEPLVDQRILCCSHSICYSGATDTDGRYLIGDIDPADVYKMQAADPMQIYSGLYYYQEIISGELSELDRDVILPRRLSETAPWSVEDGGSVTLANGALELIAEAGTLEFPIGLEEELSGDRLSGSILPPYTEEPWSGRIEQIIAFTFNPGPISAARPVRMRVSTDDVGAPGTQWRIYSINPDTAAPDDVGTGTVDADGVLVSDDESALLHMLTIILVPLD